ncbi:pilin [uncultured Pseudoteredinibacter sp.]|uniref:pilin n=1 Tax=uncultured Pseudoteredinibacter sp. TaxID=1641701 RepID=UPI002612C3A8|nr:pilin [uncultured Pseudoteredinibacter sp.]
MKNAQKGFTLIELMIVVAIIGILAAVALPAYQDYNSRAKVSEPVALLSGMKIDVAAFYTDTGLLPDSMDTFESYAGPKVKSGKYVEKIEVSGGGDAELVMTATLRDGIGANINGKTVSMKWITVDGLLTSSCGAGDIGSKFLPADCRDF